MADPRIIRQIIAQGQRRFKRPKVAQNAILSALMAGFQESGLRNLNYGDADSLGWRQERASIYPDPNNIRASVGRYFDEWAADAKGRGLGLGQMAQAVQGSAFPSAYDKWEDEARQVFKKYAPRKGILGPGRTTLGAGRPSLSSLLGGSTTEDNSKAQMFQTLASMSTDPRSQSNYALMASLAQPTQTPQIKTPDLSSLLGANMGGGEKSEFGEIVGSPSDRPGVKTSPYVVNAVRRVAGIYGKPITLGTGTQHSQMTVNGNVSRHWTGEAIDLPASGRQLILMGQAALIDAGMNPREARKQNGGLFNVNGAQIIFNTQEGGDHTDHLHYQPRRPAKRK